MKKFLRILSVFFVFACVCVLASCGNKIDIKGELTVTPKLTSLDVVVDFDANSLLDSRQAKPYVEIYDVDGNQLVKQNLTFYDNVYITAKALDIKTNIKQDTEYKVTVFVTYNSLAYEICSTTTKTLSGGDSEENPILINDKADIEAMANYPSSYFKLAKDIDLGGATLNSIFTTSKKFTGHFDGNNKKISNFTLTSTVYMGLFGYVSGGEIKDLTLSDVKVSVSRNETYLGILAGRVEEKAEISNCKVVNSSITFTPYSTTEGNVGGLFGYVSKSQIVDCSVENTKISVVKARYHLSVGLVAGFIDQQTKIDNTHAAGEIGSSLYYTDSKSDSYLIIGGFVGKDQSGVNSISNSTTNVSIKVTDDIDRKTQVDGQLICVGGFVGTNLNNKMSIKNSAAIADIDLTAYFADKVYVGGFVGAATDTIGLNQVDITNCLYTAKQNGIAVTYNKTINDGYKAVSALTSFADGVDYYTKEDETYLPVDTDVVKKPESNVTYYVSSRYLYIGKTIGYIEITNASVAIKNVAFYDALAKAFCKDEEGNKVENEEFVFVSSTETDNYNELPQKVREIIEIAKRVAE